MVSEPVCPGLLLHFQKFCKSIVKDSHYEVNYVNLYFFKTLHYKQRLLIFKPHHSLINSVTINFVLEVMTIVSIW